MKMRSLSLCCLSLLACGTATDDRPPCVETSVPAITDGELLLVRNNEPQRWIDAEYSVVHDAEFTAQAGSVPEGEQPSATRWLQAWVDHFDTIVRSQFERELGAPLEAPHPQALLIADAPGVLCSSVAEDRKTLSAAGMRTRWRTSFRTSIAPTAR